MEPTVYIGTFTPIETLNGLLSRGVVAAVYYLENRGCYVCNVSQDDPALEGQACGWSINTEEYYKHLQWPDGRGWFITEEEFEGWTGDGRLVKNDTITIGVRSRFLTVNQTD